MSALGPDIRAALAATRLADAAPSAIRQRGRQRLMNTLAAGAVTTSVAIAEAANLVGSGATMAAGTAASSSLSLIGSFVTAAVVGLSLGLAALSPSSRITENPSVVVAPQPVTSVPLMQRGEERGVPIAIAVPKNPPSSEASTQRAATGVPVPEQKQRDVMPRRVLPAVSTSQPEAPLGASPKLETSDAQAAAPSPIKASIARELELISDVRRALINGHAGVAIVVLNRQFVIVTTNETSAPYASFDMDDFQLWDVTPATGN